MHKTECLNFFDSFARFRGEMIAQLLNHQIETIWHLRDQDYNFSLLKNHEYEAIVWIIREVVSNVIKHSRASMFSVETQMTNFSFQLRLSDNGIGIAPKYLYRSNSFGLTKMKRIIQEARGLYRISSSENGTEIMVFIQL